MRRYPPLLLLMLGLLGLFSISCDSADDESGTVTLTGQVLDAATNEPLANAFVRPVLVVLTIPITVLTMGLFLIVVNDLVLKLAAALVPGFRIRGFLPAIWGALLLAVLNVLVAWVAGPGMTL